jgi:hypothetical protein
MAERTIRMLALEKVFYRNQRIRPGMEFDMLEADLPRIRDEEYGNEVYDIPTWCAIAGSAAATKLYEVKKRQAEQRVIDGAIAASSPNGTNGKDSFVDAMTRLGSARNPRAEAAALAASGTEGAAAKKAAVEEELSTPRGPMMPVKDTRA